MATKKTKKPARKSKTVTRAKRKPAPARPKKKAAAPRRVVARKKAAAPKKASVTRKPPKKPAPKKKTARVGKKTSVAKAAPVRRRAGGGRLPPAYAAGLRAKSKGSRPPPEPRGFIDGSRTNDDLAEELGEEFIADATSGEAEGQDMRDQAVPEERGGPFVLSSAGTEFAGGTDASNPKGSKREPFPTT